MKKTNQLMSKLFKVVALVLLVSPVFALANPTPKNAYECELLIISDSVTLMEKTFDVPFAGGAPHGGDSYNFSNEKYRVELSLDNRWMTIDWSRADQTKIAVSLFVLGEPTTTGRVAMMWNPTMPDERLSLGCYLR